MKRGDTDCLALWKLKTNKKGGIQVELLSFVTDKDLEKYPQYLAGGLKRKDLLTYLCLQ